mmetsp:Transcript_108/g.206  ORF Transcript_108/g.206 Transcript_108/m.206 type:complete len:506 (+) Transcript_108:471-1988(+)
MGRDDLGNLGQSGVRIFVEAFNCDSAHGWVPQVLSNVDANVAGLLEALHILALVADERSEQVSRKVELLAHKVSLHSRDAGAGLVDVLFCTSDGDHQQTSSVFFCLGVGDLDGCLRLFLDGTDVGTLGAEQDAEHGSWEANLCAGPVGVSELGEAVSHKLCNSSHGVLDGGQITQQGDNDVFSVLAVFLFRQVDLDASFRLDGRDVASSRADEQACIADGHLNVGHVTRESFAVALVTELFDGFLDARNLCSVAGDDNNVARIVLVGELDLAVEQVLELDDVLGSLATEDTVVFAVNVHVLGNFGHRVVSFGDAHLFAEGSLLLVAHSEFVDDGLELILLRGGFFLGGSSNNGGGRSGLGVLLLLLLLFLTASSFAGSFRCIGLFGSLFCFFSSCFLGHFAGLGFSLGNTFGSQFVGSLSNGNIVGSCFGFSFLLGLASFSFSFADTFPVEELRIRVGNLRTGCVDGIESRIKQKGDASKHAESQSLRDRIATVVEVQTKQSHRS